MPSDNDEGVLSPPASSREVWNCIPFCYLFNYPFSRALAEAFSLFTARSVLECSEELLPQPPPPAAAPARSFTTQKCQYSPAPSCSLEQWVQRDCGNLGDLDTWLHAPGSWAPHCSQEEGCLRRLVSKQGCGCQTPQERLKARARPASLPGDSHNHQPDSEAFGFEHLCLPLALRFWDALSWWREGGDQTFLLLFF